MEAVDALIGPHGYLDQQRSSKRSLTGPATKRIEGARAPARLAELRNRCVIAHGFEGLSRDALLEGMRTERDPDALLARLRRLLELQGIDPGSDPYEEYAQAILALDKGLQAVCLNI